MILNNEYILLKRSKGTIESLRKMGIDKKEFFKIINKVPINIKEDEKLIMRQNISNTFPHTSPVVSTEDIAKARKVVREVYIDEKIENYITDIVFATRFPVKYNLSK